MTDLSVAKFVLGVSLSSNFHEFTVMSKIKNKETGKLTKDKAKILDYKLLSKK